MAPTEVRKRIEVALPRDEAFRRFTEGIGEWWPLETHSIFGADNNRAIFEPRLGGRIYELADDGRENEWGRVLAWDAPASFTTSWQPSPTAAAATEYTVRFEAIAGSRTAVELVHIGWDRLGDAGERQHANYDSGWDEVLAGFARVAVA